MESFPNSGCGLGALDPEHWERVSLEESRREESRRVVLGPVAAPVGFSAFSALAPQQLSHYAHTEGEEELAATGSPPDLGPVGEDPPGSAHITGAFKPGPGLGDEPRGRLLQACPCLCF